MDPFTRDDLCALRADRQGPCVSLLMRTVGGGHNDRASWKAQLQAAEEWLRRRGEQGANVHSLLGPARDLLDDAQFWLNVSDGVAAFLAPGLFRAYRVALPLGDQVVVGDRFCLEPLLPLLDGDTTPP